MGVLDYFKRKAEQRRKDIIDKQVQKGINDYFGSPEQLSAESERIIRLAGLSIGQSDMEYLLTCAVSFHKADKPFSEVKLRLHTEFGDSLNDQQLSLLYDYVNEKFIKHNEVEALALIPQIAYVDASEQPLALYTIHNDQERKQYERRLPAALRAGGYYIQEGLKETLCLDALQSPQFAWLQSTLLHPAFQHLCFRYKNQVFSVLIALGKNCTAYVSQQDYDNQIRECKQYNMVPCVIPLDADDFHPLLGKNHLRYTDHDFSVNIRLHSSNEPIKMSDWEIQDMGIQVVRDDITRNGGTIDSYCNVPGINPQIWFTDKNGQRCYVVVVAHIANIDTNKPLNVKMYTKLADYPGYYAEVGLGSVESGSELYRGCELYVNYNGLETIERAAIRTGGTDEDIFIL